MQILISYEKVGKYQTEECLNNRKQSENNKVSDDFLHDGIPGAHFIIFSPTKTFVDIDTVPFIKADIKVIADRIYNKYQKKDDDRQDKQIP